MGKNTNKEEIFSKATEKGERKRKRGRENPIVYIKYLGNISLDRFLIKSINGLREKNTFFFSNNFGQKLRSMKYVERIFFLTSHFGRTRSTVNRRTSYRQREGGSPSSIGNKRISFSF